MSRTSEIRSRHKQMLVSFKRNKIWNDKHSHPSPTEMDVAQLDRAYLLSLLDEIKAEISDWYKYDFENPDATEFMDSGQCADRIKAILNKDSGVGDG